MPLWRQTQSRVVSARFAPSRPGPRLLPGQNRRASRRHRTDQPARRAAVLGGSRYGMSLENEWQSFRTRQNPNLELTSVSHTCAKPGRYVIAVKVIDIFGNDTMTLVPVTISWVRSSMFRLEIIWSRPISNSESPESPRHALRCIASEAGLRPCWFWNLTQRALRTQRKKAACDRDWEASLREGHLTMRSIPFLRWTTPKLIRSPRRRSLKRSCVKTCLLCTGTSISTDFNSTITLSSTSRSARKPSSNSKAILLCVLGTLCVRAFKQNLAWLQEVS